MPAVALMNAGAFDMNLDTTWHTRQRGTVTFTEKRIAGLLVTVSWSAPRPVPLASVTRAIGELWPGEPLAFAWADVTREGATAGGYAREASP